MARHSYLDSLLGEHERVIHVTRQHWILLARNVLLEIILIGLILIAVALALIYLDQYLPRAFTLLVGFLLLLIPIATLTRDVISYSERQFIITNRRVIAISGVLDKNVTDSSLEKVNDVRMTQSAIGRLFNFGDIEILTASELGVNFFKQIFDPVHFKTAMLNAKQALDDHEDLDGRPSRPVEDIPAMIARLGALHQEGVLSDDEFNQKKAELLARL